MFRVKLIIASLYIVLAACNDRPGPGSLDDNTTFKNTTQAIQDGFAKGDVEAVLLLHHPDVIKYFGGTNVVTGRAGLRKQLTDMFNYAKVEFVKNEIESTVFDGNTVTQTSLYGIRVIPKNGDSARTYYGRSMVMYVRYKDSPTGWASIREMTQEAPAQK